jgi:hypothetical protein
VKNEWFPKLEALPEAEVFYRAQDQWGQVVDEITAIAGEDIGQAGECEKRYHGIGIFGFSNGGAGAVYAQEALCRRGIKVDVVLTADPIPQGPAMFNPFTVLQRTKNVRTFFNHYQRTDFWLKGWEVKAADVNLLWSADELEDGNEHVNLAERLADRSIITNVGISVPESRPYYIHEGPCK